ncbi:MAG: N-acetylglucosamine-6-phosphate deacetylase [Oscillospiraceae bacterium]|nr:N-acetylglucosamine-6-phosphate deacetylase [Oscillospiraceae bacterium]
MRTMLFTNARIFTPEGWLCGGFKLENGRFAEIGTEASGGVDLCGARVIPGLVDIHTHGAHGADFSDGDGLRTMARYLAKNGVTSFCPTSMTLGLEALERAFSGAAQYAGNPEPDCARVVGIHMEGPFLSEKKKGAQNAKYLRDPDFSELLRLYNASKGLIRIVDVAPELKDAAEFAEKASALCTVSVAHTDADYDTAARVFDAGARHLTHLFNAMPQIHHRAPGVIGAASERGNVTAELICDGEHVHPSAVRMAFRLFPGRICLISDSLRTAGMPDGEYTLGGQSIYLKNGAARLADGSLAGSSVSLFDCLRNAVRFGIPEKDAIIAASLSPARAIGAEGEIGSIEAGKRADFAVCDDELHPQAVYIGGNRVQN